MPCTLCLGEVLAGQAQEGRNVSSSGVQPTNSHYGYYNPSSQPLGDSLFLYSFSLLSIITSFLLIRFFRCEVLPLVHLF